MPPKITTLPWRGPGPGRPDGLPLPDGRMPLLRRGQLRKRWRWVGGFGDELMFCAARATVGPLARTWWAMWDGTLHEGGADVRLPDGRVEVDGVLDLSYAPVEPVETISRHGRAHIWTAKQGGIHLQGTVALAGRARDVDLYGLVDDSAGYHAHRTDWLWSAGVGTTEAGDRVAWNLVTGLHDAAAASERSVWVNGTAHEVGPVEFAPDLTRVSGAGVDLEFTARASRAHEERSLLLFGSSYEQPFGTFAGSLPIAGELARGHGVMERHSARW